MTEQWTADWPYRLNDDGRTCSNVTPLHPLIGPFRITLPLPDHGYDYFVDAQGRFARRVHPRRETLLAIWGIADELNANKDVCAFTCSRSAIGSRVYQWLFTLRHREAIGAASYERHWLAALYDTTLDKLLQGLKRCRSALATPAVLALLRTKIRDVRRLRDELMT